MRASVACGQCGARMRADRPKCLRCDAPLRPPAKPGRGAGTVGAKLRTPMAGGVLALIALLAIGVVRFWSPDPQETAAVVAAGRPASAMSEAPDPTPVPTPAEAASVASEPAPSAAGHPAAALPPGRAGNEFFKKGDLEAALIRYEEALARNPNDVEVLNNMGQTLVRLDRPEEAGAFFQGAIRINPERWAFRFNYGNALARTEQWREAVEQFREAARLFPDDHATHYNLARALHKQGDPVAAVDEYQKAIALAANESAFHLGLAMSCEQIGRKEDAVAAYTRYLELAPMSPDAPAVRAKISALSKSSGTQSVSTARPAAPGS